MLSADKPLSNPKDDRFGYAPFARTLAKSLLNMAPDDGLVIALYGTWGSGKSSTINFVEKYLDEIDDENDLVRIHFNPWWFSGQDSLAYFFFDQLQTELRNNSLNSLAELIGRLKPLGRLLSKVPTGQIGAPGLGGIIGQLISNLSEPKEIERYKLDLAEAIAKSEKRFLILIDDIDRLTAEEIRLMFTLIKAIADFPNTTYLLSFDQQIVTEALNKFDDTSGQKFLEKIVQVEFQLPAPGTEELRQLLTEELSEIFGDSPLDLNTTMLMAERVNIIMDFMETPRDVKRFVNSLRVTYSGVENEVHAADFVTIESLRIFAPEAHAAIRTHKDSLLYTKGFTTSALEEAYSKLEQKLTISQLLNGLFPQITSNAQDKPLWWQQLRICSPEHFDTYFRFSIPDSNISSGILSQVIDLSNDESDLSAFLVSFYQNHAGQIVSLFTQLQDSVEQMDETQSRNLFRALINHGDNMINIKQDSGTSFDQHMVALIRLIHLLLQKLDPQIRHSQVLESVQQAQAIETGAWLLFSFEQNLGKWGAKSAGPEPIFEQEAVLQLETIMLEKIRVYLATNALSSMPIQRRRVLIDVWGRLDKDSVKQWIETDVDGRESILCVAEACLSLMQSETDWSIDISWLCSKIDDWLDTDGLAPHQEEVLLALQNVCEKK